MWTPGDLFILKLFRRIQGENLSDFRILVELIIDIEAVAEISAHRHHTYPTDWPSNTFGTPPYLIRPSVHDPDIVVHGNPPLLKLWWFMELHCLA